MKGRFCKKPQHARCWLDTSGAWRPDSRQAAVGAREREKGKAPRKALLPVAKVGLAKHGRIGLGSAGGNAAPAASTRALI